MKWRHAVLSADAGLLVINRIIEQFGKINERCYKFTASLSLVDYVRHVLLGTNEQSLSSKAHGLLLTLIRWFVGFAT